MDGLVQKYAARPEDSLKKEAALFFRDQYMHQSTQKSIFREEPSNKIRVVDLDTISGEEGLSAFLNINDLVPSNEFVPDSSLLTDKLLESHINSYDFCVRTWEWNRKADKRTLFNYLLAYKIYEEEAGTWRDYFTSEHIYFLKKVLASRRFGLGWYGTNPMPIAVELIGMANNWYSYDNDVADKYHSLSFRLMKCLRKGNCYFGAYTGVYVLRSFGIPAAVDYVPFWGSRNGGHAEVAALDSNGKMSAIPGHMLQHAAKVFRLSFMSTNIWSDSIRPMMGRDSFLLPDIAHDHWVDATADHTAVADVEMTLCEKSAKAIGYICAFNYGVWQPVYWGRVQNGDRVCFRNMGKDILYYAALPNGNGFRLSGHPFLLDTLGRQQYFTADFKHPIEMRLTKLNTGSQSWVKKQKIYELYCIDHFGGWQKVSEITCRQDSILPVVMAPSKGIYRLLEKNGKHRLDRPFGYADDKQVWW